MEFKTKMKTKKKIEMKTIKEQWEKYKELVFGKDISKFPDVQISEMKKAFYGSYGMALVYLSHDLAQLPVEHAITEYKKMMDEIQDFHKNEATKFVLKHGIKIK